MAGTEDRDGILGETDIEGVKASCNGLFAGNSGGANVDTAGEGLIERCVKLKYTAQAAAIGKIRYGITITVISSTRNENA